jgi:lysophospholipase L1-like esterase
MIPGRYLDNYNALKNILQYGKDKKIHILLYIPPLRNDVSPPYNINGYNSYKKSVEKDAKLNDAFFLNLEDLVPAKLWGIKASTSFGQSEEIDFMHFQQEGHRLIADTIYKTLEKINVDF